MNAALSARAAYLPSSPSIQTARETEYSAFSSITAKLSAAAGDSFASRKARAEAIFRNQLLWNVLAADAASSGNDLAPELRAQIVYLAEFTRIHSAKVLQGEAGLEPLIEINSAIMRGLRGQVDGVSSQ